MPTRKTLRQAPFHAALAVLLLFMIAVSCRNSNRKAGCIMPEGTELKPGDIVLRKGTGLMSRAVTIADGGSDYSHCGIVVDSCGKMMVVHAVPDEPDFDGDVDRVKMESPESFFSSIKASKGCILRYTDNAVALKSAELAAELYRRGMLFDNEYDDSDTTKMYCSQLVAFVYGKSGIDITNGIRHDAALPGIRFSHVIYPSDFLRCSRLQKIGVFTGKD